MPIATPHIDLATVLQLVSARLATITGVTVAYLGSVPPQGGPTALVLRIKDLSVDYPQRNRNSDGDEGTIGVSIHATCPPDGEAGGLLGMAKLLNAVKQVIDREDLVDATTTLRLRCSVVSSGIVDVSEPGGDNGAHGALSGAVRIEAVADRTSGTTLTTP